MISAILCALVIFSEQSTAVSAVKKAKNGGKSCSGFGYELLTARIEHLETRLVEQQSAIAKVSESLEEIRKQNEQVVSLLTNMNANLSAAAGSTGSCDAVKIIRSCSEEPLKTSGRYLLQPKLFHGYCEQEAFGGGWLVFHNRFDGSVSFDRNWDDYRSGFGNVSGEFWLGLEKLHRITRDRKHILLVEIETFDGRKGYAKYDGFEIGSEAEKFSLKHLGSYSGTAGDSLDFQKGMSFSTKDRDNAPWHDGNCVFFYKGAWWHNWSSTSSLNGPYGWVKQTASNFWVGFTNDAKEGLKRTRMMVKEA